MTATPEDARPRRASTSRAAGPTTEPVREVCPYLEAESGGWRSIQPTRDHRCTATSPASPLAQSKQRDLCLVLAHFGCATYQAARDVAAGAPTPSDGGLWPETRGAVLSLEPVRGSRSGIPGTAGRGSGQAMLVGLMVIAFLVLVIARVAPPVSGDAAPSAGAGVAGSADPGASIGSPPPASATPQPTATSEPSSPTPDPSAGASATAVPASAPPSSGPSASPGGTTYRVRPGDTLSGIAARYGTTVKVLKAANGLSDSALIRPGQVLVIPD